MSGPTRIRDAKTDHLITPQNAVITFIDYQPDQYAGVGSIDTKNLLAGVITLGEIATAYGLPVVLSTVGVKTRGMEGSNQELKAALPGAADKLGRQIIQLRCTSAIAGRCRRSTSAQHGRLTGACHSRWTPDSKPISSRTT